MKAEPSTAPSPFSTTLPTFQTHWDSMSLGWLKDCPRLYYYHKIKHLFPRHTNIHLLFGQWYASGVELYANLRAKALDHDAAVVAVVKWAMCASGTREADGTWTAWNPDDPTKNRPNLIRTLIWNLDDRNLGSWRTYILPDGAPAVELSFRFKAFEVEGESIHLCGHMDEVVYNTAEPDRLWVKDDKTTKGELSKRYFDQYTPNNQMSLYSLAGKIVLGRPVSGVLIRGAQIGTNFNRFATHQAPRTPAVLAEWLEDTHLWVQLAHTFATKNHWPMNDKSCDKFGGCSFRKICSLSPSHRAAWLKDDFVVSEWNPLRVR